MSKLSTEGLPSLEGYRTVVLNTIQSEVIVESGELDELMNWVREGGRLWNVLPDMNSEIFQRYPEVFGIVSMKSETVSVSTNLIVLTDFMIGSKDFIYNLEDFSTYALDVTLDTHTVIHAIQSDTNTPLIWEREVGKGRIVVNNIDLIEKSSRGMLAAG
ncbi:MAG: DUF2194 domain-containing protein [Alkalibacterium sp.]|nr:DUF2194 domain-containing protein [Alkalibacterium sp.]